MTWHTLLLLLPLPDIVDVHHRSRVFTVMALNSLGAWCMQYYLKQTTREAQIFALGTTGAFMTEKAD